MKKLCSLLPAVLLIFACGESPSTNMVMDIGGSDIGGAIDGDLGPLDLASDGLPLDLIACEHGAPCQLENEFGVCSGSWKCDAKDGPRCTAVEPEVEICDGNDNDCDGVVDDIPCDDLDLCTDDDRCLDGACAGTTLDCDDENPCTEDSCDSDKGCLNTSLSGVLCDDNDLCTVEDFCDGGACTGVQLACDDEDPCTMDFCNSTSGCVFEAADSPCDDEDPCTVGDICSEGLCEALLFRATA